MRSYISALFATLLMMITVVPAFADTYRSASFIGNINSGSPNVKAPFTSELTQGNPISGSFIIDTDLIPTANSGFVNVFFSSFPDSSVIPAATAFTIDLGAPDLTFTLDDAIQNSGAIQFNNGVFKGFFFDTDFIYANNPYRLDVQGGTWTIKQLDVIGGAPIPLSGNKVTGVISGMSLGEIYIPTQQNEPVPEPSTLLLLGGGLAGLAFWRKRKQ